MIMLDRVSCYSMSMLMHFRKSFRILPTRAQHNTAPPQSTGEGEGDSAEVEEDEHQIYDRDFVEMTVEDFASISNGDQAIKEQIETILSEYDYLKFNSLGRVPQEITPEQMQQLVEEGVTPHARSKLFNYLFKREMAKRQFRNRQERLRAETKLRRAIKLEEFAKRGMNRTGLLDENGEIIYGLWHNSLFCRIPENKIKQGLSASRLKAAALFGRKLIFDFGFEEYMVKYTTKNAIEQVQEAYGINRYTYEDPFDFWFCNLKADSFSAQYVKEKAFKGLQSSSMITVKEDCFTNHFDKSKLVYLSPNAREPLNNKLHKSDDVYIIGVYNDKGNHQPITYRKALKLGIRSRRLPLDEHIVWQGPSKSLCVNHVTGIMLEVMANRGDWKAAFDKHIPKRKVKPMEVVADEEEKRLAKLLGRRKETPQFNLRRDMDW